MSLKDRPRFGCLRQFDIERTKVLSEDNPPLTIPALSAMLGCNQSIIYDHSHDIEKVNKLGTWLSHQLTLDNTQQRVTICNFLLSKRHRHRFLQQIVAGDESGSYMSTIRPSVNRSILKIFPNQNQRTICIETK